MAPEDSCVHDMLVLIRWPGRNVIIPLSQLVPPMRVEQRLRPSLTDTTGWRRAAALASSVVESYDRRLYGGSNMHVAKHRLKSQPGWTDVKAKLEAFDRTGLVDLIHDLYAVHKDNKAFLHARFALGEDVLEPYMKTLARWLWPDPFRNQDTSVSKAKQAISHYKKAVGDPAGLTELMVFYCEQAAGYCQDIGYQEEGFFDALVRMFEQALKSLNTLPADGRDGLVARLNRVREISHAFGYGVGDDMDFLLAKYTQRSGS
jgi:hypothetical protein